MAEREVSIYLPKGRRALVVTNDVRYDAQGNHLGKEVIQIPETFSYEEVERLRQHLGCPECGGIDEHKSYFVNQGQDGFGTVNGYTKKCSRTGDKQ